MNAPTYKTKRARLDRRGVVKRGMGITPSQAEVIDGLVELGFVGTVELRYHRDWDGRWVYADDMSVVARCRISDRRSHVVEITVSRRGSVGGHYQCNGQWRGLRSKTRMQFLIDLEYHL